MMPKNMMEYLVAIIALVALGLSIAAIAKKCKDNFADPGTCINRDYNNKPVPCGGSCDTNDDYQYCSKTYGCDECVANNPTPGAQCNYKVDDKCWSVDDVYNNCGHLTCAIHNPNNVKNPTGKVVDLRDPSHWGTCSTQGGGCYRLHKGGGAGCCGGYDCVGQNESGKSPFTCKGKA